VRAFAGDSTITKRRPLAEAERVVVDVPADELLVVARFFVVVRAAGLRVVVVVDFVVRVVFSAAIMYLSR